MARLRSRNNANLLAVAIGEVAQNAGIPRDHVEKDFWLTECLRGLATYGTTQGVTIMFKGGTSLSKAFKLIQRFSEDADMVVVFPELSTGNRDRHLKGFIAAAETATSPFDSLRQLVHREQCAARERLRRVGNVPNQSRGAMPHVGRKARHPS